jgi:hypothetical protein
VSGLPNTHWAEEVVEEVASFPAGEHDDYVDSVSLALMRFRKGGYIRTALRRGRRTQNILDAVNPHIIKDQKWQL